MLQETMNSKEYKEIENIMKRISNYPIQRDTSDVKVLIQLVELEEAVINFKKFLRGSEEILKNENPAELAKFILETRLFALHTAANSGPEKKGNNLEERMKSMREMGELLIKTIDANPGAIDIKTILKAEDESNNNFRPMKQSVQSYASKIEENKKRKPPSIFGKSLGFESE